MLFDALQTLGMMAAILLLLAILCCSSQHASAFLSPSPITKPLICCAQTTSTIESDGFATSRRSFAEDVLGVSSSISLAFLSSTPCYASGGATAGGAYLLSAKQRYNERKSAALVSFIDSVASQCTNICYYFLSFVVANRNNAHLPGVTAGCKTFLNLDGDVDKLNVFFDTADVGGWEDFSAAGYLLSNAFRTSSTKPPGKSALVLFICMSLCVQYEVSVI